ncbi:MAG: hypothetical protein Q7J77_07925 [Undibacterium sp.]|nr:hypothetical protein [Undibacterium sp.]
MKALTTRHYLELASGSFRLRYAICAAIRKQADNPHEQCALAYVIFNL